MRFALLADVHANLEAFEACLAHARARGAARIVLLGDLVGYGADPEAVLTRVMALRAEGAIVLKGNHDAAIDGPAGYFNEAAREALQWTRSRLDAAARAFLASLPLVVREGDLIFVHASARDPERWTYLDGTGAAQRCFDAEPGANYLFAGHTHGHRLYAHLHEGRANAFVPVPGTAIPVGRHRRWLAVVGAVGQPRDGDARAAYALFDEPAETITFHRVAYDHAGAAGKVRAAGLPRSLAQLLEGRA
ncbi:hypothetical protein BWI17_21955 [Betaproteobacteria bacterium GR16-43]|nr:hypothetical protein BWI17_21955 [Betaproteobacteria bacterium GR16-43]